MRYFINLAYKGTPFNGWQRQQNAASVQQCLEENLSLVLRKEISVTGCGRTDTGVHAHEYFAHFEWDNKFPENFIPRLNHLLPKEIGIYDIFPVKEDLHARFNAISRTYKYFIHFQKDPFKEDRSWLLETFRPDIEKMNHAAKLLLDFKDFSTFEKKGSDNKTSLCILESAFWKMDEEENGLVFTITADRFLRNMVRRVVGTLMEVGLERMELKTLTDALENKTTLEVGLSTPAHGLHLWAIKYNF